MSRIIFDTATTLNGFLADGGHSLGWLFAVPSEAEARDVLGPFMADVGALAMGSTTYRWILDEYARKYGD